jgi:hypothetical protein
MAQNLFEELKTFSVDFEMQHCSFTVKINDDAFYFVVMKESNGYYCTCAGNHTIGSTLNEAYSRMLELIKKL